MPAVPTLAHHSHKCLLLTWNHLLLPPPANPQSRKSWGTLDQQPYSALTKPGQNPPAVSDLNSQPVGGDFKGNSGSRRPSLLGPDYRRDPLDDLGVAQITWMILESSSKEFLQSPQYSCASCRMYLFTLAEVELRPPLPPESSWHGKEESQAGMAPPRPEESTQGGLPASRYLWLFGRRLVHFAEQVLQLGSVAHQLVVDPVGLVQEGVDVGHRLAGETTQHPSYACV